MKSIAIIITIILCHLNTNLKAANLNSDGTHPSLTPNYSEPINYKSWRKEFFQYLISNKSIKVQAIGISLYYSYYPEVNTQLTLSLNKILQNKLNKEGLTILKKVCGVYSLLKNTCEKNNFHKKLIKSDSKNLNHYISDLNLASYIKDYEQVAKQLKSIKESNHASTYYGLALLDIKKELIDFFKFNQTPTQEKHPIFETTKIDLSPEEKIEVIINTAAFSFHATLSSTPNFQYFETNCEKLELQEVCAHVVSILAKSKPKLLNHDANRIKKNMSIANKDYQIFKNIAINLSKIHFINKCNSQYLNDAKPIFLNYQKGHPLYYNVVIKNTFKLGLDKAFKLAKLALGQYLVNNSLINLDSISSCEYINMLSDDKFLETYQDNYYFKSMLSDYNSE